METMTKTFTLEDGTEITVRNSITLPEIISLTDTITNEIIDKENYKVNMALYKTVFAYAVLAVFTDMKLPEDISEFYFWMQSEDFDKLWPMINPAQVGEVQIAIDWNLSVFKESMPDTAVQAVVKFISDFINNADSMVPKFFDNLEKNLESLMAAATKAEEELNKNTESGGVSGE